MEEHRWSPAEMAALHTRCFTLPPPWSAEALADTLAGRGCFLLTRATGFLIGRSIAGETELLTLAVDPDARRQGTGGALLKAFLERAAGDGSDEAFLEVASENAAALALYQQAGFASAGRRRDYYRATGQIPQDAIIMRCAISQP